MFANISEFQTYYKSLLTSKPFKNAKEFVHHLRVGSILDKILHDVYNSADNTHIYYVSTHISKEGEVDGIFFSFDTSSHTVIDPSYAKWVALQYKKMGETEVATVSKCNIVNGIIKHVYEHPTQLKFYVKLIKIAANAALIIRFDDNDVHTGIEHKLESLETQLGQLQQKHVIELHELAEEYDDRISDLEQKYKHCITIEEVDMLLQCLYSHCDNKGKQLINDFNAYNKK